MTYFVKSDMLISNSNIKELSPHNPNEQSGAFKIKFFDELEPEEYFYNVKGKKDTVEPSRPIFEDLFGVEIGGNSENWGFEMLDKWEYFPSSELTKKRSVFEQKIFSRTNYLSCDWETLLSIKSEELDKIKEIVVRRKIVYLVHFTRIENLNSILENGLIPVRMQEEMQISSVRNDEERMDAKVECTSCSVSFPNYKLFYKFRNDFFESSWVVILLNKDILFSPSNITYFCDTNAARVFPVVKNEVDLKKLCMANAFENMFCSNFTTKDNKSISRSALQISDNYTTDPQAEILISAVIDKKYIEYICFSQHSNISEYIAKHGKDLLNKYRYNVYEGFFTFRNDYEFWKKEN